MTADGRQLLAFEKGMLLVFDADGTLLGGERRNPPRARINRSRSPAPESTSAENFLNAFAQFLASPAGQSELIAFAGETARFRGDFFGRWLAEYDFRPGTIRVRKIDDPSTGIAVEDMPAEFEKFLADPAGDDFTQLSPEEREELRLMIAAWRQGDMFLVVRDGVEWLEMTGEGDVDNERSLTTHCKSRLPCLG